MFWLCYLLLFCGTPNMFRVRFIRRRCNLVLVASILITSYLGRLIRLLLAVVPDCGRRKNRVGNVARSIVRLRISLISNGLTLLPLTRKFNCNLAKVCRFRLNVRLVIIRILDWFCRNRMMLSVRLRVALYRLALVTCRLLLDRSRLVVTSRFLIRTPLCTRFNCRWLNRLR